MIKSYSFVLTLMLCIESCGQLRNHASSDGDRKSIGTETIGLEKEKIFEKAENSLIYFGDHGWLLVDIHYVYSDGVKGPNILNEVKERDIDYVLAGDGGEQQVFIYSRKSFPSEKLYRNAADQRTMLSSYEVYTFYHNAGMIYPNNKLIRFSLYGPSVCEPFTQFRNLNVTAFTENRMYCDGPIVRKENCPNTIRCEYVFKKLSEKDFDRWKMGVANKLLVMCDFEDSDVRNTLCSGSWYLSQIYDVYRDISGNDSLGNDMNSVQIGGGLGFFDFKNDSLITFLSSFDRTLIKRGTYMYDHTKRLLTLVGCAICNCTNFYVLYISDNCLRFRGEVYSKAQSPKAVSSLYVFRRPDKE